MNRFYIINVPHNHWRIVDRRGYDVVLDVQGSSAKDVVLTYVRRWNRIKANVVFGRKV